LLEDEKFSDFNLKKDSNGNEIGDLQNSLISLKNALESQRNANKALTENLELQIADRTYLLNEARNISKLANFSLFPSNNEVSFSTNFYSVLNSNEKSFSTIAELSNLFDFTDAESFIRFLRELVHSELPAELKLNAIGPEQWFSVRAKILKEKSNATEYIFVTLQDITDKRKSEEEMNRLSFLAKHTTNGIVFTDIHKKIIWVNDSLLRLTGYSREEIIGNSPRMFQFEGTDVKINAHISDKLKRGESVHVEVLNKGKHGNIYWLELYIQHLRDLQGNLIGYMAVEIDITERKEKEAVILNYIREIEEKQREIARINEGLEQKVIEKTQDISRLASFPEQFDHPIVEFKLPSNEIIYKNPKANTIFGSNLSEVIATLNLSDEFMAVSEIKKREIVLGDKTYDLTAFMLDDDKICRLYLYDTTLVKDNERRLEKLISILRETEVELKQNQEALQNSLESLTKSQAEVVRREKLAALGMLIAGIAHEVNTPLGAIKASSENLEYLFLNDLFEKLTLINNDELKMALVLFRNVESKRQFNSIEERTFVKDMLPALEQECPNISNPQTVARSLVRLGYTQLNSHLKGLLNDEKRFFPILEVAEVLAKIFFSLKTINEGSVKGSKMIRALNSYSHGGEQEQKVSFSLHESVENVITILWNKIKHTATIKNNLPEHLQIVGYQDELSQVWTNIINNALQASANKCNISINYSFGEGYHQISIVNDGPMIPQEVLPKIFDEFFTTKKRGEGTGLGLNIVKKIIEKHNGTIHCESNVSETRFIITLPK
jgi:PAS domain S-box-containing protein